MATPKSQRIGIWIIAVVMLIGTIGSFAVMILASENAKTDQEEQNKLMEQYQKEYERQEKEAEELSAKYYPDFKKYKDAPKSFDVDSVGDDVKTKDLKKGSGETIKEASQYRAYYIGWTPDGKSFDSSFDGDALKVPFDTTQATPIEGWRKGVEGMNVGGVREMTLPAELAYGEAGSGESIPPNTPIKFIVMVIETVEQ